MKKYRRLIGAVGSAVAMILFLHDHGRIGGDWRLWLAGLALGLLATNLIEMGVQKERTRIGKHMIEQQKAMPRPWWEGQEETK